MTHLAYNATTGEVLTTTRVNQLKRWIARYTANDMKWAKANGIELPRYSWVFTHGSDYADCVAKLTARREG